MKIRIGTRKSRLAVRQTELVCERIRRFFPDADIEITPVITQGDKQLDLPLGVFGGKGVFTRELEDALSDGRIDLAVHSAKDMPMEFREGLCVGAVLEREDPRDVLVTREGISARSLPRGSVIGTSSLRREIQIREQNSGVEIKLLRGNVQTRLEKLRRGEYDGILLAAAGLKRLGLMEGTDAGRMPDGLWVEYLDPDLFIPAAGQGIMAVEIRRGSFGEVMSAIHSQEAAVLLQGERTFLDLMGGGCNAPCGVICRHRGRGLDMSAMYARDGKTPRYERISMAPRENESMGELAARMALCMAGRLKHRTVSLVGAGPGTMDLVTGKALECVRRADVILYDHLIPGSLLNEAPLDAELIYSGKCAANHHLTQEQIIRLLVEKAREGRYVVRLKGGDPFVFGRGGEEALALKEEGIPFEIVPGVSSAYSVPAYAGIPVTYRETASSFHVITGHECEGKAEGGVDYETLAKERGTLVFLMALGRLRHIADRLMECGKPAGTPAAVIQQGATARQRQVISTLDQIAGEVRREGISTPAIVVVGEAVGLGRQLDWRRTGPLSGARILITGSRLMARRQQEVFEALGAETLAVSLIEPRRICTEQTKAALRDIASYQWVVFTSRSGVELFFEICAQSGLDLRKLAGLRFAAVGRETSETLREKGLLCDFAPSAYTSACLADEWIPILKKDERVLLARAAGGSDVLLDRLGRAGQDFTDLPLYETWTDFRRKEELNRLARESDYITVASGSAVKALGTMASNLSEWKARIISIGPVTTDAAQKAGVTVFATAAEYTAGGMADKILEDWGRRQWKNQR